MGDLAGEVLGLAGGGLAKPLLSFQRYDAPLEPEWLKERLGKEFSPSILASLRDFTNPNDLATLKGIGQAAAAQQVKPEHFSATFDDIWKPA